jgi:branched-chain amino acid transport system substrate-binding protein
MKLDLTFIPWVFALLLGSADALAQELKVGVVLGLSGPAQVWADYSRKGLELGVSELNASSTAKRKLRLFFEDSKSTPASAVSAFRKLVHQDKVDIVVGDVWTFLTVPLVSIAEREHIVLISPTVMDRSVPEASDYFFSLGHRFESLQPGLERFFALNTSIKTAGVISFDDYWNNALVEAFSDAARRAGVEISKSAKVTDFNPEFRTEVATIKGSKAGMLLTTWRPEVALQRMHEQNYDVPYLCSSDTVEAFLFRAKNREIFEGMYFLDWKPSKEFSQKFEAKYGAPPLYEAQNSYEIIRSIGKALETGKADLRLAMSEVFYDGVSGRIDFRQSRFPNLAQAKLYRIENGAFVEK